MIFIDLQLKHYHRELAFIYFIKGFHGVFLMVHTECVQNEKDTSL